jgi:hypothetical protein
VDELSSGSSSARVLNELPLSAEPPIGSWNQAACATAELTARARQSSKSETLHHRVGAYHRRPSFDVLHLAGRFKRASWVVCSPRRQPVGLSPRPHRGQADLREGLEFFADPSWTSRSTEAEGGQVRSGSIWRSIANPAKIEGAPPLS